MKREREPTKEELKKLLAWFSSKGKDYTALHSWLTRLFVYKGIVDAEDLADEVMRRVAVRVDEVMVQYEAPGPCLWGFHGNVYREFLAAPPEIELSDSMQLEAPDEEQEEKKRKEREDSCLTGCLKKLKTRERDLLLRYHDLTKRAKIDERKSLARKWGLSQKGLRTKVHRLCKKLRLCMEFCLKESKEH